MLVTPKLLAQTEVQCYNSKSKTQNQWLAIKNDHVQPSLRASALKMGVSVLLDSSTFLIHMKKVRKELKIYVLVRSLTTM